MEILVAPDYSEAFGHMKKREEFLLKIEHYEAMNAQKGGEPAKVGTTCICCGKVEAIEHFTNKVDEETVEFRKTKAANDGLSTHTVYLITKSEEHAQQVISELHKQKLSCGTVVAQMAP
jgi:hypothetical protein